MKKKIFLTGGTGFIGQNIKEQLTSKYEIFSPNHSELDLTDSMAVSNYLKELRPDAVIHAANIGGNRKTINQQDTVKTNLKMFFNVARCRNYFGKMIQIGSGSEYDHSKEVKRVSEEDFDVAVPTDDYGFYKYVCSKYIENTDGITCLRLFGCFGKYEDYEVRFISNALCKSIFNHPITLANKNAKFSYIYVNDLVRIIEYFINNDAKFKFYNIVPDETYELISLANIIKQITKNEHEVAVKNAGMASEYTGKNTRLRSELKEFRFTPIGEAITELYRWYVENKQKLNVEKIIVDKY